MCPLGWFGGWRNHFIMSPFAFFQDHFKRINGTSPSLFESHLAEILWRNRHRSSNRLHEYLELIKLCYPLSEAPRNDLIPQPLFDSWEMSTPWEYEEKNSVLRVDSDEEWPTDIPMAHSSNEQSSSSTEGPHHASPPTPQQPPLVTPPSSRRRRDTPPMRRRRRRATHPPPLLLE